MLRPPEEREPACWKRPDAGERLDAEEEEDSRGCDSSAASLIQWTVSLNKLLETVEDKGPSELQAREQVAQDLMKLNRNRRKYSHHSKTSEKHFSLQKSERKDRFNCRECEFSC